MILQQGTLFIEHAEMQRAGISPSTMGRWEAPVKVSSPANKKVKLYAYELLAARYKELVKAAYGNPYEHYTNSGIKQYLISDKAALEYYRAYRSKSGKFLPRSEDASEDYPTLLSTAAMWMNLFIAIGNRTAPLTKEQYKAVRKDGYAMFRNLLERDGVKLPYCYSKLLLKKAAYEANSYAALIPANLENQNAKKVKGDNEIVLKQVFGSQQNLDAEAVALRFNIYAAAKGLTMKNGKPVKVTAQTVRNNMEQYLMQLHGQRNGYKDWHSKYRPMVSRQRPSSPLYMVAHDGWDVELYYRKQVDGKWSDWNRKVVVVVIDAHCDYPLGYAISDVENAELIAEAYRHALHHVRQLTGEYYLPWQLKGDNFSFKSLESFYARVANGPDWVTPIKVGNSQDNPAEQFFSHLNTKHCQPQYNWSGRGFEARKENQANRDYLRSITDQFPTEEGVIVQIMQIMDAVREAKREEWMSGWMATPDENKRPITRERYLQDFGITRKRSIQITNQGLSPEIDGREFHFMLMEHEFYNYIGSSFTIQYDPYCLDDVLAVCQQHRVQFVVPQLEKSKMAFMDMREGDRTILNRALGFRKELEQRVIETNATEYERAIALVQSTGDAATIMKVLPTVQGQQKAILKRAEAIMKGEQMPTLEPARTRLTDPNDDDIYNML